MIRIGTFCSGIGAPEMALRKLSLPHSVEFACEIDKYARQTYLANYEPKEIHKDLTAIDYSTLPNVDLFVAGFPCQSFSMAGKRLGTKDPRGTIFFNIYEYLEQKKPPVFILENVPGLLSDDGGYTFRLITEMLAQTVNGQEFLFPPLNSLGYHIYYKVLNAVDYGLPQYRRRIFIVGFKDYRPFQFPVRQALKFTVHDLLEENPPAKYYLPKDREMTLREHRSRNKANGNGFGFTSSIDRDIAPCVETKVDRGTSFYIETSDSIRLLTPTECMRLMGFPDSFKKPVSEGQQYKQAGNSIAVNVLMELFREIYK